MATLDWIKLFTKSGCNKYEPFNLYAGDGVEFEIVPNSCTDNCCQSVNDIYINAVPVGSTWSVFEVAITDAQATSANTTGLNLTGITWTTISKSNGDTTGSFTTDMRPHGVYVNGQRLSLTEYTIVAGVFTMVAPSIVSDGDNITFDVSGS